MIESRGSDRLLDCHAEVDEVRDDLDLNLGLDMSAFEAQGSERLATLHDQPRHQCVHAALVRTDAVRMTFIQREQMSAILQDNPGFRFDDSGAKAHEIALTERYEIAFTVRGSKVFGIGNQGGRFQFTRSSIGLN